MPDHCMGTCSKTSGSAACFFCSTTTDRSTRQLSKATAMTWHWQPISPKLIVSHHAADCVSRQHASRSQDCPRTPLEPKQPSPRAEYTSNQVHAGSNNSGNHCLISEQRLLKHIDQNHRATNQTRAAPPPADQQDCLNGKNTFCQKIIGSTCKERQTTPQKGYGDRPKSRLYL